MGADGRAQVSRPNTQPLQYKGDTNYMAKSRAAQDATIHHHENVKAELKYETQTTTTETAGISSVADGSDALLKTFDLNAAVH